MTLLIPARLHIAILDELFELCHFLFSYDYKLHLSILKWKSVSGGYNTSRNYLDCVWKENKYSECMFGRCLKRTALWEVDVTKSSTYLQ